jgi:cytochrome P460
MNIRSKLTIATVALAVAGLSAGVQVHAGGDRVAFPESYAKGVVYLMLDKPDNKQVREYFTSPAAAEAAKKGQPLPDRTVITAVQYAAQLDAQGNPSKDANGRLTKTNNIVGYAVMEKRAGWGAAYPENVRNGDWEYQAFRADKTPNPNANLSACFNCHKPQGGNDFVFTHDSLKVAAR